MPNPATPDSLKSAPYNEMLSENGEIRPHWQALYQALTNGGPLTLKQLGALSERLLRGDGASYSIHGDTDGLHRAWPLDVAPLLLQQAEWLQLEQGIIRRARLLDLMLKDIYGPQRLIREGIIPANLIFGHPGYLRSWVGASNPRQQQLTVYGLDMARTGDGRFHAISDRTQNPSGTGYALENRIVMARVLPELFKDSHILRLAQYFSALRETLVELAPEGRENPCIVLLTPGSRNETYFEQSFIARYLGISLVEGQDLYVSKGHVWLRSLTGEEKVDVIIRRVDDDYCDPLEFRGESLLGVAGITEVARRGNVSIVNPIGAGVLENPALFPYLDAVARYFAEPEPTLPQAETWWCGEPQQCDHVLKNLPQMVIKPIWRRNDVRTRIGAYLDEAGLDALRREIRATPENWVAQNQLQLSEAPCSGPAGLEQRGLILRGFAVAHDTGYTVMAGGLTRVSSDSVEGLVSNQIGSLSKDTWIVSSDKETQTNLWLHPQHKLHESAPERLVYGRSADNLFWMGRYIERTDMGLNLLAFIGRSPGLVPANAVFPWPAGETKPFMLGLLTELSYTYPGFTSPDNYRDIQAVTRELRDFCTNADRIGSLANNATQLVNAAKRILSLLSTEQRRVVGQLESTVQGLQNIDFSGAVFQTAELGRLKDQILAMHCLIDQSMIRGLAWRFLDMGRRFERALALLRLKKLMLVQPSSIDADREQLDALLLITDNEVNYQQRYAAQAMIDRVLDLLLLEVTNPRSVAYQVKRLVEHLESLPVREASRVMRSEERLVIEANTQIRLANSLELGMVDETSGQRENLNELVTELQNKLIQSSQSVANQYFTRITAKQQTLSPVIP
ncbi:MAG: circularly permuted type 2 ATP-grasp protein [Gammaproteobacteria bacterium]|nr:circularly permuted type 2 ATP-grasp protein [Gammaproteobacteria bacterium]